MAKLVQLMNKLSDKYRIEIEENTQKMIEECKIHQLYNELSEYENSLNQEQIRFNANELETGIQQLKNYVKAMGGTLNIRFDIDFPTGKHINTTI